MSKIIILVDSNSFAVCLSTLNFSNKRQRGSDRGRDRYIEGHANKENEIEIKRYFI